MVCASGCKEVYTEVQDAGLNKPFWRIVSAFDTVLKAFSMHILAHLACCLPTALSSDGWAREWRNGR